MSLAPTDVTRLIQRLGAGDEGVRGDLWTVVYDQLRQLAAGQMARERGSHTLQPTALVHEVWLRLTDGSDPGFENRAHFFGVAAEAMRRILVEHARRRGALRRGGDRRQQSLDEDPFERLVTAVGEGDGDHEQVEALDTALAAFEQTGRHERKVAVVKLRFFVGMTIEQVAELLGTSPASVKRDWDFAKAWLSREIGRRDRES